MLGKGKTMRRYMWQKQANHTLRKIHRHFKKFKSSAHWEVLNQKLISVIRKLLKFSRIRTRDDRSHRHLQHRPARQEHHDQLQFVLLNDLVVSSVLLLHYSQLRVFAVGLILKIMNPWQEITKMERKNIPLKICPLCSHLFQKLC